MKHADHKNILKGVSTLDVRRINMRNRTTAFPGDLLLWNKLFRIRHLIGLLLCLASISLTVAASPSDLDATFGNFGKVVSSPDGLEAIAGQGMALQSDGKIVRAGWGSGNTSFTVARYNANGSLDTTFGTNGQSSTTFGYSSESAISVAIQPDGKIVVGGAGANFINNFPSRDFVIARFNPDGSLDPTFDGDGKMIIDFNSILSPFYNEYFSVLKIGSDGKIVAGGYSINGGVDARWVLARINPDGSLDTTFGTGGKVVPQRMSLVDTLTDLVVLPDGKIIVCGYSDASEVSSRIVVKYNLDGTAEWTYLQFMTGFGNRQAFNGIAMQPDGKIVVVGRRLGKLFALRLNAGGTEDSSFTGATFAPNAEAFSVAVQPDGKIVANLSVAGGSSFSLVRYNATGAFDTGFGTGGVVTTSVTSGTDTGKKVIIQPDGKILVGGSSSLTSPSRFYITMVRYQGAVVIPDMPVFDFDGDGKTDVGIYRPSSGEWWYARSSDGQVPVAQFGASTDRPVPADFTGDGRTDIAFWRPSTGEWFILRSEDGSFYSIPFGTSGDVPVASDFDGDGRADVGVFRPSTNEWFVQKSSGGTLITTFGTAGDLPVVADYDGDGRADIAIYRPSQGQWWIQKSTTSIVYAFQFGNSTDKPVQGDFTGDGKADAAFFRPQTGYWFILRSEDSSYYAVPFGAGGDLPAPGDYDGDGKFDTAVFRPASSTWYVNRSTAGLLVQQFGLSSDIPLPSAFVP
jgi:uncharacterized delta-60 repeat protein